MTPGHQRGSRSLDAAERAAKDAARLRDEEGSARLGGKASKYEQRRVEAQKAQELALQAASNKDKTDRAQELQRKIEDLKARKEHMDPTPKEADQEAAFWAKVLGLKDDAATKAMVSEWISYAWAILGELILLGMTANLRNACGLYQPRPKQPWLSRLLAYIPRRPEPPETSPPPRRTKTSEAPAVKAEPVPEVLRAAAASVAATAAAIQSPPAARSKKANDIKDAATKPAASAKVGDIREWKENDTRPEAGGKVLIKEAYAAYVRWCEARGKIPLPDRKFSTAMRALKVVVKSKGKKAGWYVGLVLAETTSRSSASSPPTKRVPRTGGHLPGCRPLTTSSLSGAATPSHFLEVKTCRQPYR